MKAKKKVTPTSKTRPEKSAKKGSSHKPEKQPGKEARRLPLSRERILLAALSIADTEGLDALSMRRIAAALKVEAMSLYKHIADKEQLLDGLVDLVLEKIEIPSLDGTGLTWQQAMTVRAHSARRAFSAHPWAVAVFESRKRPSETRIRYGDGILRILRQAGFSVVMAYRAFLLLDSYIYGFLSQELNWAIDEDQIPDLARTMMPFLEQAPYFKELMQHAMSTTSQNQFDREFEFGLQMILSSLESYRHDPGPKAFKSGLLFFPVGGFF